MYVFWSLDYPKVTLTIMSADLHNQLILSKLEVIIGKLDALSNLNAKVDSLQMIIGTNSTSTKDELAKIIHNEIAAGVSSAKEKKKVATAEPTGETKTEEKKSLKKTHPTFPEITEAAWKQKTSSSDEFDKRMDWFIAMKTKYPTHIDQPIGADEVKRVQESPNYAQALAKNKKQGDREKAKSFLKALVEIQTTEGKFADLSKKLIADYDAQLAILNSAKIGQLTTETQSVAEALAASALSGMNIGDAVTVHTNTATSSTSTAPATSSTSTAPVVATSTSTTATPGTQLANA